MEIRLATGADVPAITEIYNHAIQHTTATFDTEVKTVEQQRAWFEGHGPRHPIFVSTHPGASGSAAKISGWASLNSYSDRCAYSATAENSVYVHPDFQRRGIGRALLARLLTEAKRVGIHAILARITEGNDHSVRLHQEAGFFHVGTLREVGLKFNRQLDVAILQWLNGSPAGSGSSPACGPKP
ncbi:MAG: N-acetyltransferase family protein [Bacteriovoracia bacterium]